MSSLAATQADGYYLPPEYYESQGNKKKPLSKNQWYAKQQKQKASSSSSKTATTTTTAAHNQFLANGVVRFELPYNALCLHCSSFIGKGTRFNAEKQRTGESYYSSTIWEFHMTCRHCGVQHFVIRTNPAARGFDYVEGLQKLARNESSGVARNDDKQPLSDLERLERQKQGQRQAMTEMEQLQALQKQKDQTYLNDAGGNAKLRAQFRVDRQTRKRRRQEEAARGWNRTGMRLVDTHLEDERLAKERTYGDGKRREKNRLRKVRQGSIFENAAKHMKEKKEHVRVGEESYCPDNVLSIASATISKASLSQRRRRQKETSTVDLTIEPTVPSEKQVRRIVPQGYKKKVTSTPEESTKSSNRKGDSGLAELLNYSSDSE